MLAACMGFLNACLDLFQTQLIVARPQRLARLPGLHRIGAKVIGGAHLAERAGGQK